MDPNRPGPSRPSGGRPNEPDFWSMIFGSSSSGAGGQPISLDALFNLGPLPPRVRTHLRNVFLTLFTMTLVFTLGILLRLNYPFPLALSSATSLASILALHFMGRTQENLRSRMGLLLVTAAASGISSGDLVGYALQLNPTIVLQAALASTLSFGSFALSALTSERRSWLFLGGGLGSFLSIAVFFQLFSVLLGRVSMLTVYVGVVALLGFVLYDTQMMVERAHTSKGWLDPVNDSLHMFQNLVGLFRRLIVILSERERARQREEADKRRRGGKRH